MGFAKIAAAVGLADYIGSPYEHIARNKFNLTTETFAQAVTRIGNTPALFLVDRDIEVTDALVIPETLKLAWMNNARLINRSGSIEFEGNPFVYGQELSRSALFQDFDTNEIAFTGETPTEVSSEICWHDANSLTTRLNLLTYWFDAADLEFHCMPRPITATLEADDNLVLSDGHSLYFRKGEFDNTYQWGWRNAVFVLGSNAKFHSEHGAIIYESGVGTTSVQIVTTRAGADNAHILNNYFKSNPASGGGDAASANVLIAGSSTNCTIKGNIFDGISGYHAGIAQTAAEDPPFNCKIEHNTFKNFLTQLAFITSGLRCSISYNDFLLENVTALSAFAVLDVEPNFAAEVIDDLDIIGNYFDTRNVTLSAFPGTPAAHQAILVQSVNTVGVKNVNIFDNKIYSTSDACQLGIGVYGADVLNIARNTTNGTGTAFDIAQCNKVNVFDNIDNTPIVNASAVTACRNVRMWNNTHADQSVTLTESEKTHSAGGNGSDTLQLTKSYSDAAEGRIYDSYIGGTVTFQDVDYVITDAVVDNVFQSLTVNPATLPSVGQRNVAPADINVAANTLTVEAHDWVNDQYVGFGSWGSAPGGLPAGNYYVKVTDPNTIQLSLTAGGAAIDITTQGSHDHGIHPLALPANVNTGTDTITEVNHQLADLGAVTYFGATPIGGLANSTVYYIIKVDDDNFQVATTRANAVADTAINLTSQGAGQQFFTPLFVTKFSNNIYKDNTFTTYNLVGTSKVVSRLQDERIAEVLIDVSDETTDLTTGTAKVTFRMPYGMTLTELPRASVTTAPTGATLIVDINEAGASILSTKLSIDAGEKTSTTAAAPAVLSDTVLADDAEMTIDIDQIGSTIAGTGLKVWLIGKKTI